MRKKITDTLNDSGLQLYKKLQKRVSKECHENLVMLCVSWQNFVAANEQIESEGLFITTPTGFVRKSDAFTVSTKALESYNKIAGNLGLFDVVEDAKTISNEFKKW